ncbi:MAG: hypothetical protein KME54_14900 [Tolypothrix brevis GSE-NOS-MK-07-07A]|nr:hypothetical protein [Tolypothrix brevis GSE-NOS-MK-07-07A]
MAPSPFDYVCDRSFTVIGIDNNMQEVFFGEDTLTGWNPHRLLQVYGDHYIH